MIAGIRHVGLVVADLSKAIDFWCGVMGFVVKTQMDESGDYIDSMMGLNDVLVTTVKLSAPDGNLIELLYFHSHPDKSEWLGRPYSTGFTHIALTVFNLDEEFKRLKQLGVSFPSKPQFSPDGRVKVIYAKGPEGVLLELVEAIAS
jgi:catechol 2,3-dioxygenase-like lactoylglutathione lyase family enzyme